MGRRPDRQFSEENIQINVQQVYKKVLNILKHQGTANKKQHITAHLLE